MYKLNVMLLLHCIMRILTYLGILWSLWQVQGARRYSTIRSPDGLTRCLSPSCP
jgi:hypothetical protein